MSRLIVPALMFMIWVGCKPVAENHNSLKTGMWRAVIDIQGQQLPFNFEVARDNDGGYDIYVINGEERLLLDEVTSVDDSVHIGLHIFDADIHARVLGDSLRGTFVKNFAQDYRLPFKAVYGANYRFPKTNAEDATADFSGKYEVTFFSGQQTRKAIALFEQSGDRVTGTFMTPTGDYRYLSGIADGPVLKLSAFDGDNIYLFHAAFGQGGKLKGEFFSGKTRRETWVAEKNENASLPDTDSLTYLKAGYERISFRFPDANGKMVSPEDEKYRGKVVILQLLGTWCPNCMDETRFLSSWYERNKDRGVEIIGLAFENKDDFNYASQRVKKMTKRMNVQYDVVIAGSQNKEKRKKALPMLNTVTAFPTTIFIGKNGDVKKIHTGFSGPGTGKYYDRFVEDFNETVNTLLKEDLTATR